MRCLSKCDSLCNIHSSPHPPSRKIYMYLFYGQIKLSMNWLGWKISLQISNRPNSLLSLYSRYIMSIADLKIFVPSVLKNLLASHIPLHHIFHYCYFYSLLISNNNNFTYLYKFMLLI